jgi:3-oxosteroid 1-dehydrogenase
MAERDDRSGTPALLARRAADGLGRWGARWWGGCWSPRRSAAWTSSPGSPSPGWTAIRGWSGWASTRLRPGPSSSPRAGFEWNPALRHRYLPADVTPISAPSNTGDGLVLGIGAGAATDEMTAVWGVPVLTPPTDRYDGRPGGRMGNVEMTLPGSVTVDTTGRRFVNEALNYHDLNRAFGGRTAFLVFDRAYRDRYPVAGSPPGTVEPWMVSADTPAELARCTGIDPDGLATTLAAFNAAARLGQDPEFGRGANAQDRHLGDPAVGPNPCLAALETAPYLAVPIHAGALGTAGGLTTNLDGLPGGAPPRVPSPMSSVRRRRLCPRGRGTEERVRWR